MAFLFSEHFRSNAKIIYLHQFRFGHIEFEKSAISWKSHSYIREHDFHPKFPVIIKGDGLPWDIANVYLVSLAKQKQPWEIEFINTRAKGLLAYLRFLEDSNLDFLHLPKNNRQKAPYRFRSRLKELINNGLSVSYASNCIRAVIDFYKHIVKWKLINEALLDNAPYKEIEVYISYISSGGFSRIKRVETSDISIKVPETKIPMDRIKDGGLLRPLSVTEQRILKSYISSPNSNTSLSLMMKIAITTGARLQTICTLRSYHIDYLYSELEINRRLEKQSVRIELSTGMFRDIDTKNGVLHSLRFSPSLIESLYIYSVSEASKKRMSSSYYGVTRDNYLFLTRDGNPFYTSKKEIHDRLEQGGSMTVNGTDFSIKSGGTVDHLLKVLVRTIQEKYPDAKTFRFHDLRATFGMNLVRNLSSSGISGLQLLIAVKDRMGHKDISVTQRYLDFDEMLTEMTSITEAYEKNLFEDI